MTNADKNPCPSRTPNGYHCTRMAHTLGLHEARTDHASPAIAVWSDSEVFLEGPTFGEHMATLRATALADYSDSSLDDMDLNEEGVTFDAAELAEFVNGYCEAAEFANAESDFAEPIEDSKTSIDADCKDFLDSNAANIARYMSELNRSLGSAGADFYFNRNGHGTGFWDRSFAPEHVGFLKDLSEASHPYGETPY